MSKKERQTLSLDLETLFPGESLTIGKNSVLIRPLNISQIAILSKKIKGIGDILSKEGVTWENYSEQSSLFKIAVVLLDMFPDVLEEAADINVDDLKQLPLESVVEIVTKVIEVNLRSKDTLTKNFKSLTEKLVPQDQKEPNLQDQKEPNLQDQK
jgi:hypothetical protein